MCGRTDRILPFWVGMAAAVVLTLGTIAESSAADAIMDIELLASATADECFVESGNPLNTWYGAADWPGACDIGTNAEPKVNQAYIWGLTLCGDVVWFGTAANPACIVAGTYLGTPTPGGDASSVCEFGVSQFGPAATLPEAYRDWRPPDLFAYDTLTDTLIPLNGKVDLDPDGFARRWNTLGIRSAGCHNGVVFLAGPVLPAGFLDTPNAINVFAFDADSREFLGSTTLEGYINIRSWVVARDNLYTGVQTMLRTGEVLKWTGDKANPFQFQTVGYLPSEPASFCEHEGRLLCTTWPGLLRQGASLWMSPRIPNGGLTRWHSLWWRELWSSDEYEPDELLNATYGGGPVASFDGCIFWGTMHVPYLGYQLYTSLYGVPETPQEQELLYLNTHRATSVFRGALVRRPGLWGWLAPDFEYDLLYGEAEFSVGTNPELGVAGWETVPNNMGGVAPLYGPMGFEPCPYPAPYDISFNFYSWSSAVGNGQLFWGTVDVFVDGLFPEQSGADLWRFPSCDEPAVAEFTDGAGNGTMYGVRNMASDGTNLYLGMATYSNLLTVEGGDPNPGGWKLLKLTPLLPP